MSLLVIAVKKLKQKFAKNIELTSVKVLNDSINSADINRCSVLHALKEN